jgi:hypothetical protein
MSVLLDTSVLYAHHDSDAEHHKSATDALTRVLRGKHGQPYVTDYIYDETVTLTRYRMSSFEEAKTVSDRILEMDAIRFIHILSDVFEKSIEVFEKYDDHSLSFTDATTVAVADERGIDAVMSFDNDFDGIVERLNPEKLSS